MTGPDAYGHLIEPATLKIQRLLPGPIERVWAYLTQSELRRQWLAAGEMDLQEGAAFELIWRNDELTDPAGMRPSSIPAERRMRSHIIKMDPPRMLTFAWEDNGDVSITLEPKGDEVLLTLVHRRLPDRQTLTGVSAGWHTHLAVLNARLRERKPDEPFWDGFNRVRRAYDERLPG